MNIKSLCRWALACLISAFICACTHNASEKKDDRPPVRVKTMTVADSNAGDQRTYSGTVEEESGSAVSFSAAGTIRSLSVAEGQSVKKGQLIGVLDDASLRNAYDIAKATLDQARDAYERMKLLHDSNSLPEIKWVDVQSKLHQAQSAAEIARIALDDARLYAPVSGVVSEKMASVGQTVAPGVPVVKIVDINAVKVNISVPESEIASFAIGSKASIKAKGAAETVYTGTLVEKAVTANPLSRSYQVKYTVDNPGAKLLPGMICEVETQGPARTAGVVLPVSAVMLAADNTHFVWLDSAGTACKRFIRPAEMLPQGVLISSGLTEGDKVIVAGMEKVSQGTKVSPVN